jgi:hypothetical protein
MGSRIASPLQDEDHQLDLRRLSQDRINDQDNRNGLKRNSCWKRRLLRMPRARREAARKTSLKRSPLKREGKGHKAELAKYNASAPAFFAEPANEFCLICVKLREDGDDIPLRKATIRHHHRGRIGRLLNWRPGQIPSCTFHQLWPHEHPARARKLGLLCEPAMWNTFPAKTLS